MILDIVNNLVLQAQPRKKELDERLQTLRFETQLHSVDDQRKPILELQNEVRALVMKLRHMEREIYLVLKELDEQSETGELVGAPEKLLNKMTHLNTLASDVKEKLYSQSEELNLKLSVYNETQITAHNAVRRRWLLSQVRLHNTFFTNQKIERKKMFHKGNEFVRGRWKTRFLLEEVRPMRFLT
jgi:hypothetical protein